MKKYLLDTHFLLWLLLDTKQIKQNLLDIILDGKNQIFYSDISLWEIAVKMKIGKLSFDKEIEELPKALHLQNVENLPLKHEHIFETLKIDVKEQHKDPFDRLIIAQAKSENLVIITNDAKFLLYSDIDILF